MIENSQSVSPEFAALIGLDWGDRQHALALFDTSSHTTEMATLTHSPEHVHAWLQQVQARFQGRPVALSLQSRWRWRPAKVPWCIC